jgi:hypothetical protein
MKVSEITVEVRDSTLTRVGQITAQYLVGFESVLRLNNVGNWSITLPAGNDMAEALRQPGAGLIVTGPQGVILSGPTTSATLDKTSQDPEGEWQIAGVDDSVILADHLAFPDPSNADPALGATANDVRAGVASSIMCAYVDRNIGVLAPAGRKLTQLAASVDPMVGSTLTGSARFEILGELLDNLASIDSLNFDVKQIGSQLQFVVSAPADRSAEIRMDIANNTLSKSGYGYSSPEATRAIVGGSGTGVSRMLVSVSTSDSVAAESAWARRIERFIDDNNESASANLLQRGQEELAKTGKTLTSVEIVPSSDLTMRYGIDWHLGDKVGVTVGEQEVSAVVTSVALRIDADGLRIGATVGEPSGVDYEALVARKQTQTATRVNALELKESLAFALPVSVANGGTGTTSLSAFKESTGLPYAMAAGSVSITPVANTPTSAAITFPAGRFTVPPIVTVTASSTVPGSNVMEVSAASVTATGALIYIYRTNISNTTVYWSAVQMTSTSAAG